MCVCVCARARVLSSVWLFVAPWTAVCQAPLPTRHGIFKDHVKLCLSTTNTNAKKQTELLSCVETFCNNGEVCVSVCVRACVLGEGSWSTTCQTAEKSWCVPSGEDLNVSPTQRHCVVSRGRAGTGAEERGGRRQRTSSASEDTGSFHQTCPHPSRASGFTTGNGQVWLNLSLQLPREELAPKGNEQSVEFQGLGHSAEGNPFLNTEESCGLQAFPGGTSGKESICQGRRCRRCGFGPWFGKIPWRRERQPSPAFSPGQTIPGTEEPGGLQCTDFEESDGTEGLTTATSRGSILADIFTTAAQHSTCWEMKRKLNYKPTREDVRLSWSSLVGSFTRDILYQDIFRHRKYLNWPKSVRGPSISYNRVAWIQWRWFI